MRFSFPCFPAEFEIPNEWWEQAGMREFSPVDAAYRSTSDATLMRLREIEPPFRFPECPLDFRGFGRDRMIRVLAGFVAGNEIEPVPVLDLFRRDLSVAGPFRYRVRDGFHRFYASVAAGFKCLPVVIT